jgi:hypothetical protein
VLFADEAKLERWRAQFRSIQGLAEGSTEAEAAPTGSNA